MRNTQNFCKDFRINIVKLTLSDITLNYGVNGKSLSSFENGRSTNIEHLKTYVRLCTNDEMIDSFIDGLKTALIQDSKQG